MTMVLCLTVYLYKVYIMRRFDLEVFVSHQTSHSPKLTSSVSEHVNMPTVHMKQALC